MSARAKRVRAMALAVVLLAPGFALAQAEHGQAVPGMEAAQGVVHHEPTAHVEHGEHGTTEGHDGAHHPESINMFEFGGTHTDAHGEVKKNPPPFISTLINFALLAAILVIAVRRMVNPALATRRAAIENEIGEAQRLRAAAEALHQEYTDRLAGMEAEFGQLREEFVRAGRAEAERVVSEAHARAERMAREGELMIQQEVRQLRADLTREAVEAAAARAEQTVRGAITPADQTRLADDYLGQLERDGRNGSSNGSNASGAQS